MLKWTKKYNSCIWELWTTNAMAFRIGKVLFCCCLLYLKAIKAPGLIMADCNSMDCNLPGSSDHGILQARILEWVTVPSSRGCLPPGDVPDTGNEPSSLMSLAFAGRFFTTVSSGKPIYHITFVQCWLNEWPTWNLKQNLQIMTSEQTLMF